MLEIILDNKNGVMWDISDIVTSVTWKTSRIGRPGSLEFTLIKGSPFQRGKLEYGTGDVVRMRYKERNVFLGYIFTIDSGKDENVKITCYDQVRYLLSSAAYVFSHATVGDIIRRIAQDFKLQVGHIAETGYRLPSMVEDNQKLLDIIDKAIVHTLWNTNRNYVFYDDFGELCLRNVEDLLVDFYIGDHSLMYNFSSQQSIDSDTYNRIKLYRDNKNTGRREVYMIQDSANIAKWGLLQLYQSVDEKKNMAQIKELLDQLMVIKNRESKSLKLDCIGDIRVRAGCYVPIVIEEYGINQPFLVNECSHRFDGAEHTMSLELKVI
ncbi:XkdQ/YqbQ family protein [Caldalkalibacillus mannanilyticus]|uniref:XkdQ/YqbQ family protein n=1 Tax=Caldalkalibacillus mannanilyticus TaxID=1418 RepID=UPI000469B6E0|nr:hypothetical protein [Caldalkalibacillus mannanilyticus]